MCGIAGIVNVSSVSREQLERMCLAMLHRGPDGGNIWSESQGDCWLGHRRLRIIDLSTIADQPMISQDKRYVMVYNGEIYNFRALRTQLEKQGQRFYGTGDTEVLLEWLVRYGIDGLSSVEGMFALALWDRQEKSVVLARDPLGIKPCYYASLPAGGLIFASEVRALLASGLVSRQINQTALAEYLIYGSMQGARTLCSDIQELPAGQMLRFEQGQPSLNFKRLWTPNYPSRSGVCKPFLAEEFQEHFDAAVDSHLVSDVPLGVFLSGGIDSSALVSSMIKKERFDIRTLCVVLPSANWRNDAYYAKRVAEELGTRHSEVDFSQIDMVQLAQQALSAMDRPTIDGINTYVVSRAARESGLTVALSGLGGDELFGGYPSFAQVPRYVRYLKNLGPAGRRLGKFGALALQGRRKARLENFLSGEMNIASLFLKYYQIFTPLEVTELLGSFSDRDEVASSLSSAIQEEIGTAANLADLDAISWLELRLHMGNTMLRDTDVMSMANSLEVRVPMLHTPFLNYVQALGAEVRKFSDGKAALKNMLSPRIPDSLFQRPKNGFFLPMSEMLLTSLRPTVEEYIHLGDQLIFGDRAQQLWQEFNARPQRESWRRVWSIVVLMHWITQNRLSLA